MKAALFAPLCALLTIGCHDSTDRRVVRCQFECHDFNGGDAVLVLDGPIPQVGAPCKPSLDDQADLHLCFDDAGTGGGVDCYYDCHDPMP